GSGHYLFTNVVPGTYSVGFAAPVGFLFTTQTTATADGSDADPATGKTPTFSVAAGEARRDIDAGLRQQNANNASLGDRVWNDTNNNGIQDANESGVAGVTVELYVKDGALASGIPLFTTTTDAFGFYLFRNLIPNTYVVHFTNLPSGFAISTPNAGINDATDSDADAGTGFTGTYILRPKDNNLTVDCGIYNSSLPTGSIGDFVWFDTNKDGIQNANEGGVAGVTVILYNGTTAIATTVTDKNGHYIFSNIGAGTYSVGFSNLPEGYVFSPNTGSTPSTNSDANPSTGRTPTFILATGENKTDIDAGIYPNGTPSGKGSIGDYVWFDTNNNGLQDAGESGANRVTVTLYAANGTTVLATQKTDPTGHYVFTGLEKGSYVVGFSDLPAGYGFSAKDSGSNDGIDSDVNSATGKTDIIGLAEGEDKLTIDAGIYNASAATGSIGNYVWYDLNGNGLQDDGATGVQGVSVTLIDKATGNIIATTTTDKDGGYLFTQIPFGTYTVQFGNLPTGFNFTTPESTASATGSDADPLTGRTGDIVLNAGSPTNFDIDAGILSTTKAGLGNYVWLDENGDGIQNDGINAGLSGVLVTLYDATGTTKLASTVTDATGYYQFTNLDAGSYKVGFTNIPNGAVFTKQNTRTGSGNDTNDSDVDGTSGLTAVINLSAGDWNPTIDAGLVLQKAGLGNYVWFDADANGAQDAAESGLGGVLVTLYDALTNTALAKTTTDGSGYYQFVNLAPSSYYVVFDTGSLPTGASFTTQDATGDDTNDSDANSSTGQSPTVVLAAGEYNSTIDAGIIILASLGDRTWIDANINGLQDANEVSIPNVTVRIYLASDLTTPVQSTASNSEGRYWFDNLTPGTAYIVEFGGAAGYNRTPHTPGSDNGSDASLTDGRTSAVTLAPGERNPDVDAGFNVVTLPVQLIYFVAADQDCEVTLRWQTATELNNREFIIQRSTVGNAWANIGKVAGAGTVNTPQNYTFIDTKPMRENAYRLIQIDYDGQATTYTAANRVQTNGCFDDTDNGVTILYPNPNGTDQAWLKFYTDHGNETVTLILTDVLGRMIKTQNTDVQNGANIIGINISDLAEGHYYLQVNGNGWHSDAQKLIRIKE
ncbi:MAG: hypothetical protein RI894_210, partial [Bacteroidota bacterium]